ncbi:MAG TPA: YicC family protein [Deltaproteobacteria bacterium]|nr:YicC family protein [Deltaproteobacteria bacterium]
MPRSMTGFGQADENGYNVEIKGVNHRFRDTRVRLPRELSALEIPVRDMVNEVIYRGKADITITRNTQSATGQKMAINWTLAQDYYDDLKTMAGRFGGEVTFRDIILIPGIMAEDAHDIEEQWPLLQFPIQKAIEAFSTSRIEEGKRLKADIVERLESLLAMHKAMESYTKELLDTYRERLKSHLDNLLADRPGIIDETRMEQEVAILADKSDITEELVRLNSHITSFTQVIGSPEASIGRRLDFLLQEINRELNTIGSKCQITALSHIVIDAKTEVEKIREQVQNIE